MTVSSPLPGILPSICVANPGLRGDFGFRIKRPARAHIHANNMQKTKEGKMLRQANGARRVGVRRVRSFYCPSRMRRRAL